MKFLRYILTVGMIGIFFLPSGCSKKDKWKPVPFLIKKQESIYYSETISGNLDSTAKSELEAVKKITTEKMKNISEDINTSSPLNREDNSIWQVIQNTYNFEVWLMSIP